MRKKKEYCYRIHTELQAALIIVLFHGIQAFPLFSKVIYVSEFECAILNIDPYQSQFMHFKKFNVLCSKIGIVTNLRVVSIAGRSRYNLIGGAYCYL